MARTSEQLTPAEILVVSNLASTGYMLPCVEKSTNFTAVLGGHYNATATLTVTDPTPAEGAGFTVFVRNGTITIGGTAYTVQGTEVCRVYHSGSWSNYVKYPVTGGEGTAGNISVSGGTGVAPSFTTIAATGGAITMATGKLLGRSTASTGAIEEITLGDNLSFDGTTLDAAGGGGGFWTADTATRTGNTTFTVATDKTAIYSKGLVVRWTESSTQRLGMVVSSSYGAPNTTVTIVGDTMASIDASSFKYGAVGAECHIKEFAVAGAIGATGTDVARAFYAYEPLRVIAADINVGTAGTTNSTTVDINKGGTTMFTVKPTLASTVAASTTPYTADSATSLALNDKVTLDIDAVQTTAAIDLYVQLYVYPTRYLALT